MAGYTIIIYKISEKYDETHRHSLPNSNVPLISWIKRYRNTVCFKKEKKEKLFFTLKRLFLLFKYENMNFSSRPLRCLIATLLKMQAIIIMKEIQPYQYVSKRLSLYEFVKIESLTVSRNVRQTSLR